MKLFLSVLTCLVLARVGAGEKCGDFAESCIDDPYMARIECNGQACDCKDYQVDETSATCNTTGLTKEVTSEQCRSLCVEYTEPEKCKYFRWEKDSSAGSVCTFMKDGQCNEYLQCEGETHCVSDQVDCEHNPAPPPGPCPADSVFSDEPGAVHWTCYNPYNVDTYVSIYHPHPEVEAGTICWTEHRCTNFDNDGTADKSGDFGYNNLVAQCSIGKEGETSGTWVKYQEKGNNITGAISNGDEDPKNLKDQTCLPSTPLELNANKLMEVGVSFICTLTDKEHYDTETTPGTIILNQYNHCVLLCNFHLVMTIEPKLDGDVPTWWKYYANDEEGSAVTADAEEVKCWD